MFAFYQILCGAFITIRLSSAQDCVRPSGGSSLPSFSDPERNGPRIEINPIQVIIKSYQFHCCGKVGGWAAYVEPGGGKHDDGVYNIKFQIWRPTGGDSYVKIGENSFPGVVLASSSEINEEVESSSEQLHFQPGDVIGYYLDQNSEGNNGGLQFDESFTQEELWYTTGNSELQNECRLDISSGGDLSLSTTLGPIISVSLTTTVKDNCPSTFTSTMFCPTPTSSIAMTTTMVPPNNDMTSTMSAPTTTAPPSSSVLTRGPQSSSTPPTTDSSTPPPAHSSTPSLAHSSTPSPAHSSTPAPPHSSTPSLVHSSTSSPSTSSTTSTTDDPTPGSSGDLPDNTTGLVVGFVVALLAVIVIAVLTIVIVVVLMRRRQKKSEAENDGIANPNYDDTVTVRGQAPKRRPAPKPKPTAINTSGGDSLYEVVEGDYDGTPGTLSYQPTSIAYNTRTDEVKLDEEKVEPYYHALGPEAGSEYDYCGPGTKHQADSTEDVGGSVQYEEPTQTKFRVKATSKDPFETQGTYVPTLAERQSRGSTRGKHHDDSAEYNKLQFFEEDQIYWAPADTASDLYQQLASKKYREIPRDQIIILEQLGSGQFGQVCKGLWSISDNSLQLAVKTLKLEEDTVKFLQEAAIMGQFLHPNVVKLYGVVTVGEPVMICLEIMSNGDLRNYLRSIDMASSRTKKASKDLQLLFLRFAKEIAAGMDYLSKKAFVHRDLAARNVLVNDALTCKIGDFGMARDLMDDTYYTSTKKGKIPVKWTAPEALLYKKYSTDSDVWSYGMVLFEIWSVGQKPFSMHTNAKVLKLIQSGYVQSPPPGCPREIYGLMVDCWNPEHQHRPKFGVICSRLQAPATKLLHWSPQDSVSEKASVLGAALEEGHNLHGDLREKYKDYKQQ